jgi:hypothetical protein
MVNFRTGTPFSYLGQEIGRAEQPMVTPGHSGYFSAPQHTLDPHLFDGEHLKPDIRRHLLHTLYSYWIKKYRAPVSWSTVWLAGSGISYQWAGDRGNGDLDCLIGVNYVEFTLHNPDFEGMSEQDVDRILTDDLKANLWPQTAETDLNGQTYEVTYYVNNGAEDIRQINPYAAYNVSTDQWTVKPPHLPQDPKSLYPKGFWQTFEGEKNRVNELVGRYNKLKGDSSVNGRAQLQLVVNQAKTMFDDIHLGRQNAFGPGGSGYGDWYNFRWQAHKQAGTMQALHSLATIESESRKAKEADLYGAPLDTAAEALTKAALWNTRFRR